MRRTLALSLASLLLTAGGLSLPAGSVSAQASGQSQACSTTRGPNGAYTATACLTVPASQLTGSVPVTADVTLSNTKTLVSFVTFCLDGSAGGSSSCVGGGRGYLLRSFVRTAKPVPGTSEWTFTLPTTHWVDGSHSLLVVAQLADGARTDPATLSVTFANGESKQPLNNTSPTFVHPSTPAAESPFVIAAVGDGGGDDPASRDVGRLVSSWSPNLFLYLGDVYDQGAYTEFADWYQQSFGSLRSITAPVPGNHDYLSSSDPATRPGINPPGTAYFDYWNNLPNYYSFDAAGWHFVALNANPQMGRQRWLDQLDWLQVDLSEHASQCTVAFWHEPAFNTGTAAETPEARKLWSLVAGHATLVVNAHDHTYQRWTPMDAAGAPSDKGTVEVIAGTGGHQPAGFVTSDSRVLARSMETGALRLEPAGYTVRLDFITTQGRSVDTASLPCLSGNANAAGSTQAQPALPTSGVDQRTLEISFLVAIVLAAAGYVLAALPLRTGFALAAAAAGALGVAFGASHVLPAPTADFALAGVVLGLGMWIGRVLPRDPRPMLVLLAATAVAGVGAALLNLPGSSIATAPGVVADAAKSVTQSTLGAAFLLVVAILAVAIGAHSRMRGLPMVVSVVPVAMALILADAAVLTPAVAGLAVAREWPVLVAALLLVGWVATEVARRRLMAKP